MAGSLKLLAWINAFALGGLVFLWAVMLAGPTINIVSVLVVLLGFVGLLLTNHLDKIDEER